MENYKVIVTSKNVVEFKKVKEELQIDSPREIIVKNMYSHISAGTELACIEGLESFFQIPDTPGYTAVGKVMETGSSVTSCKKNDIVYTYGPHAQFFKYDETDRWHGVSIVIPNGIDPELAAFTHMATIAMTAIRASQIQLGDTVLVSGLGAIGNLAAQLAQLQGAQVIATDMVDERIAIANECGILNPVNISKQDLQKEIQKLDAEGASTYIDATGVAKVIEQNLDLISLNGEVILLGSPRAPYETNLTNTLQRFHLLPHCLTMKGALEFTFPTHDDEFNKHSIERNARIVLRLIKEGNLKIEPLYTHKVHPNEAQKAYDGLKNETKKYIGVVFDWTTL